MKQGKRKKRACAWMKCPAFPVLVNQSIVCHRIEQAIGGACVKRECFGDLLGRQRSVRSNDQIDNSGYLELLVSGHVLWFLLLHVPKPQYHSGHAGSGESPDEAVDMTPEQVL